MSRRRLLRAALAWLAFHPGTARADDAQTLTVFAAADLAFAFRELASAFERATGARVTLVFGSTGNFAHQIRQGGPADVFFAADQSFVDSLIAERVLLREARRPKLVFGENIRHTLQFVQAGAAEAGIVARSVASVGEVDWVPVDASMHAPLDQAAAVVRRSPRPELGLAFIQFVNGPEGRPIMKRYGFMLPGEF